MLQLSDQVKRVLAKENISQAELETILRQAAMYRAPGFTHRYFDWAFEYDKTANKVLAMRKVTRPDHKGTGMRPEERPCSSCGGEGCRLCGYYGTELHLV